MCTEDLDLDQPAVACYYTILTALLTGCGSMCSAPAQAT